MITTALVPTVPIRVSFELQQACLKLSHCEDSKTHSQVFIGSVRLVIDVDGIMTLYPEESAWDTADSGELINTALLRA